MGIEGTSERCEESTDRKMSLPGMVVEDFIEEEKEPLNQTLEG